MLIKGKIVGKKGVAHFEVQKDKKGMMLKVELPEGEPLNYFVNCPCLEPLELVGLFLPTFEEHLGEIEGVFVEEIEEKKSVFGKVRELLRG
ncbi:hypothetical protein P8X24_02600 [Pyrococcus kukulkanii]|uniref:hypothetical protein n=1 Tax=Pyrococcus kukulkanii TaxID=1609559 RepID=UPI000F0D51E6|nr:MAG: hypothetical protein DRN82_01675 [Thermococci archaeon]